jgi:hypothetical protein
VWTVATRLEDTTEDERQQRWSQIVAQQDRATNATSDLRYNGGVKLAIGAIVRRAYESRAEHCLSA